MKNNSNSTAPIIIFAFGAIVTAFALYLISDMFSYRTGTFIFVCITAVLVYLSAFLPLLIKYTGKIPQLIASGTVYYKGMAGFGSASVLNIILAITCMPLKYAIAVELAAVLIFLIYIFMAQLTSDTIKNVNEEEASTKALLSEIRTKAQRLQLMTARLEDKKIKDAVIRINEDLRYLSPSSLSDAYELEYKMSALLDSMLSDTYFRMPDAHSSEILEAKLNDYQLLYEERKNIYFER